MKSVLTKALLGSVHDAEHDECRNVACPGCDLIRFPEIFRLERSLLNDGPVPVPKGRSARMAGQIGIFMIDNTRHHTHPQRQPDVDNARQDRRLCKMLVPRNTSAATQTMDGPAGVSSA